MIRIVEGCRQRIAKRGLRLVERHPVLAEILVCFSSIPFEPHRILPTGSNGAPLLRLTTKREGLSVPAVIIDPPGQADRDLANRRCFFSLARKSPRPSSRSGKTPPPPAVQVPPRPAS